MAAPPGQTATLNPKQKTEFLCTIKSEPTH
jgi:hypothetical protein